ncbi:hypothetical protein [Fictibacillus barbaricus]|uniref:DUF4025 domain-containing protein n=1 Tax=Fictibacillus barbaricus TaxID=182136 RepID=A0ABU1TX56_9BACL|nr:hypothetical protein [Fictibacillus barbaricus]MDR7071784.1 hypothetical protein [Fictibacillus barbaricus]
MTEEKREKKQIPGLKRSDTYRGDSVDSHKAQEAANQYLNEGEISQQNNNL